jgi:predicted transposase YbfD/YdcC
LFITTLRTSPKALLQLVRQRWAIENQWHWPRDTQLGEDAYRYTHRNDVQALALCGPWLSTCCAGTVSDQSALA